jgi:hypothetical protein
MSIEIQEVVAWLRDRHNQHIKAGDEWSYEGIAADYIEAIAADRARLAGQEVVTYWDLSENEMPVRPEKWDAEEYPNHVPLYLRPASAQAEPLYTHQPTDTALLDATKKALEALDVCISLNERSAHFPKIRDAYNALRAALQEHGRKV